MTRPKIISLIFTNNSSQIKFSKQSSMYRTQYKSMIGFVIGLGLAIGGLVCLAGYSSKCNKCNKWFSQTVIKKQKLKEEEGAKDVERADKHYDKEGKYSGQTRRKQRIYGKFVTYRKTLGCVNCSDIYEYDVIQWQDY